MLALENITKTFGETVALRDVCLHVQPGEFMVLLGPTGAGKTTTLRVAAGLEEPDAGRVVLDGEDATGATPAERDVAFVFQEYRLYPKLSVYDNIAFPLRSPMRRVPEGEIRATVIEVAGTLGIVRLLDRMPDQLSGGEMQRVALGRAIVRRPRLFLMDEPLSNLDAKLREQMRVELKRIQSEQAATTLYVTHDQTEAMSMADRLAVLYKGAVQQVGPPLEVYDRPANMVVASLLGSPPMNLAPCRPAEGKQVDVGPGAFQVALPPERMEDAGPDEHGHMVFGIRPEDVTLARDATGAVAMVEARVVQSLGSEQIVSVQVGGTTWKARTPEGLAPRVGETFGMFIDAARAHLFGGRIDDGGIETKG